MESIGRKRWAIAEGYIPPTSTGPHPQMTSHETVCVLNVGPCDARVEITVFIRVVGRSVPTGWSCPLSGRCMCGSTI